MTFPTTIIRLRWIIVVGVLITGLIYVLQLANLFIAYEPATFVVTGDRLVMRGTVDRSTIAAFREITAANPNHTILELARIDGSVDDDANLALSRLVRAQGLTTHVPADGLIASGGTDLFLAGTTRTLEAGACVGVHSWGGGFIEGRDLPRSDEQHTPYLSYYKDLGIPIDFYWFTLAAAPAQEMHWMTRAEADQYSMTTHGSPALGNAHDCIYRQGEV